MIRLQEFFQHGLSRVAELNARMRQRLEITGLLPLSDSDEEPEPLKNAVQIALQPVETPSNFRKSLRNNLTIAAQHRMSGLVVEYPRPWRQGVVWGLSLGLLAATITAFVLLFRPSKG